MEDFETDKIADPDLRSFVAHGGADEQRSVIIELGLPPPRLPLHPARPPRASPQPHQPAAPLDLADIEGHALSMDELEAKLRTLDLAGKPIRLNAAQAFVVSVTPSQLGTIARWPLAGPIRPNRTHRVTPRVRGC
jgi:hypothetical protein